MDEKIMQEVLTRVDALAAKMGVGADALWGILLKQAQVSFISDMVGIVICVVAWVILIRVLVPRIKDSIDDHPGWAIAGLANGVVCVVLTIAIVASLDMTLASVINPQYWALKQVLAVAKK